MLSGNRKLHTLTSSRAYILRVDLEDFENETRFAVYGLFSVGSEDDGFRITVGGYSGNAGKTRRAYTFHSRHIDCTSCVSFGIQSFRYNIMVFSAQLFCVMN